MSMLSVRLPTELDRALPRRDRSAWVIDAIRQRLRRERIDAIAQSAAENAEQEVETLKLWERADSPRRSNRARSRKGRR